MLHDAHRAGWKAYQAGQKPPSMKPRGMADADWQRWLRGWYDAQDEHQIESMAAPAPTDAQHKETNG